MWFRKFSSLLYISYLYCEKQIKEFAVIIIGMVIMGLIILISQPAITIGGNLPPDFILAFYIMNIYNDIAFTNMVILTIWIIQSVLSIIFINAILHVGYYYDGKSWCYANSIRNGWKSFATSIRTTLSSAGNRASGGMDGIIDYLKMDEAQADILDMKQRNDAIENIKKMKLKFK